MITLLDGRQIAIETIYFNPADYSFTSSAGENLTDLIRIADKDKFSGFDRSKWFTIVSNRKNGLPDNATAGSTSILGNFVEQITTDPLAAPLDALNTGINKLFTAPGFIKAGLIVGAILVVYVIVKTKTK
jgi:hypothetical protein